MRFVSLLLLAFFKLLNYGLGGAFEILNTIVLQCVNTNVFLFLK